MLDEKVDSLRIYVLAEDFAGYSSLFWAQHGVSFLLEMEIEGEKKHLLFDTASYSEPILHNLKLLKKNIGEVDYIVISHNHYDHTGGLPGIMKEINKEISIFAHPEIFKVSFSVDPFFRYIGPPKNLREDVEKYGGIWILSREPIYIAPGVFTLGEILDGEREDWEKSKTHVVMVKDGRKVEDRMNDEIGLAVLTSKGLVVIGGCSHPGIVGMAKKAMKLAEVDKVYAVIGGFHLVNADEKRIENTVNAFREIGVEHIYTGHCTGLNAECEFKKQLGDKFHKLHAGMIIDLA